MTDIAEGLSDEFSIKVICQDRSYVDPEKVNEDHQLPGTTVEIERIRVPAFDKNKAVSRLILSGVLSSKIKRKLRQTNSSVYLSVSNPPNLPLLVGKHAKRVSSRFVYLLHDLYPDVLAKLGYVSENSPIFKYLKRSTRRAFDLADIVIVLGRDVKDYLNREYGISNEKIRIIPNWIPRSSEPTKIVDTGETERPFRIVYAGNIGETAEVELLIRAMKQLDGLAVELYIVGSGKYKDNCEKLSSQLDLKNVFFTGYLEDLEFERVLSRAGAFFVSLKKELYGISAPSKAYHYLKYGKPILGLLPENSEIALLIEESSSGIVCSDYSVDALVDSLRSIVEFKELGNRENVYEQYTKARAILRFKELLKD